MRASWLWPRTIRGQMVLLIVLAVVCVVAMGRALEQVTRAKDTTISNPDLVNMRVGSIALLLRQADTEQTDAILVTSARAGLRFEILPKDIAAALPEPTGLRAWFSQRFSVLFPPDFDLPPNSRYVLIEGRLALASEIDQSRSLVFLDLPDTVLTTDIVGPLTYQILAFLTLVAFFSAFAYVVITRPLRRISKALGSTDAFLSQAKPLQENGSQEISDLTGTLNELRDRIHHLIQSRTRMLRSISHDLRTPLTRLKLRAERVENVHLRNQMLLDLANIDTMLKLTLDYFRGGGASEPIERIDVAVMLQTTADDYYDAGKSVRYCGPNHVVGLCRPNGLARAIANLCDNAVKFGTSASIQLKEEPGELVIEVSDDGPGIKEDLLDKVLEPFFRIDDARTIDSESASYGLGLSIVDEIARAHGGSLDLRNRKPHGLTARLCLPNVMSQHGQP
jgi:signal transduction histidine kinase